MVLTGIASKIYLLHIL